MAILPEEINVKGLEDWFKENDIWYMKTFGNRFTRSGVPDLVVAMKGMFIGLEVKKDSGGVTSPLQEYNREWLERTGNICLIVDNYEDTIDELKTMFDYIEGSIHDYV